MQLIKKIQALLDASAHRGEGAEDSMEGSEPKQKADLRTEWIIKADNTWSPCFNSSDPWLGENSWQIVPLSYLCVHAAFALSVTGSTGYK